MDPRLEELIAQARKGGVEEGHALATHLRRHPPEAQVIVDLSRADEEGLRIAAAAAARGRTEREVVAAVRALAADEAVLVRITLAQAWAQEPTWDLPDAVGLALLHDAVPPIRQAAARATNGRPFYVKHLAEILRSDGVWEVRQAAAQALGLVAERDVLPVLLAALAQDDDVDVSAAAAFSAEAHLERAGGWPSEVEALPVALLTAAGQRVEGLGRARLPQLAAWLEEKLSTLVDPERLAAFGTDLAAEAHIGRLPRAYDVDETCERVIAALTGPAPRAALLLGESGAGKTAVVNEVIHRMSDAQLGGWRVLRVSPSEVMAGTVYIGEWETKVQELIRTIAAPRRVLLYIPNLHELSQAGVHAKSDRSVAGMLAPHIESGDIVIVGESTNEAFRTGLGREASLRRLFRRIELPPRDDAATRKIAAAVCAEAGVEAPDAVLDRVRELAAFYLPSSVDPGRTVGLLREVLARRAEDAGPLTSREVIQTLSATTGVPVVMLDDERALDLDEVRAFFEGRVRGQPDAVRAMVDLVALIKAGLTDPAKPHGVYLFVGPTGVGKTELARALAELLFGDAARLHRFDMSEYATYEAFERLIGVHGRPGLLTEAVRESPFAVFLLDEIEKAHGNVYDLCLQVFDAGRLTDGRGRTADFRRTIFLLTSNLGGEIATESEVGFGAGAPPPPDAQTTLRALRLFFRPEFLGRIDQVVHFRPLAEETAEWIARREVGLVLERSGLARRHLTIDVDPAVVSFLLRHGYSPALGARPLKRTVERYVLLPVARAVASGRVPSGSILRLEARRDDVLVRVEQPEGAMSQDDAVSAVRPTPGLEDLRRRAADLRAEVERLRRAAAPVALRRGQLLAQSREPGFWDDPASARSVLGEIHRWEALLNGLDTLERRVSDTGTHVAGASPRRQRVVALGERLEEIGRDASRLAFLLTCEEAEDLADAFLTVTKVRAEGQDLDGVEALARMYMGFARRRGLEAEVLDDHRMAEPREDQITLLVSGAGATAFLRPEQGLHQLLRPLPPGAGGRQRPARARRRQDRELVRVEVLPVPEDGHLPDASEVSITSRRLTREKGRLLAAPEREISIFHAASMRAVRAWGKGTESELAARLLPLLGARVRAPTSAGGASGEGVVVRRYELGASPMVRDRRSGRHTGRLDRVLAGDLDLLLGPPETPSS